MNAALFIIIACIWGGVWLPIKLAVSIMPPFTVAATRLLLAILVTSLIVGWRRQTLTDPQTRRKCLLMGVIGIGIPWIMLFWGQQYIYPGLSSIINSTVPIFVATFSWLVFRDQSEINLQKLVGIGLGFVGVLTIFAPELRMLFNAGISSDYKHLMGMLAVLGMAVCYGLHIVLLKRWSVKVNPNESLMYQSISSFLVLLVAAALTETQRWSTMTGHPQIGLALWCVAYMGLIGSVVGLNCFFRLIHRVGAVKAGTVTYLIPIIAMLVDWAYYRHLPNTSEALGTAVIFVGLSLVHFAPKKPTAAQISSAQKAA